MSNESQESVDEATLRAIQQCRVCLRRSREQARQLERMAIALVTAAEEQDEGEIHREGSELRREALALLREARGSV